MLTKQRSKRKRRIRAKVAGTKETPRLSVFRSNTMIYAQIIDDDKGKTLAEAHGKDAIKVGEEVAGKAMKHKINTVVFDRGGYQYHGKVKALADAARDKGLKF